MKYRILFITTLLTLSCLFCANKFYRYYSPAKDRQIYPTKQHSDDSLRIAFIGDSWALGHKYHKCRISALLTYSTRKPVSIESYGIGGLTSKEIYNALFEIKGFKNFMKKGYDFCILSVGINDTNKKMSIKYYKKSVECIINFLLTNHICPIILDIPDYNIYRSYDTEKMYDKIVRHLSMIINSSPIDCKQEFREALYELVRDKRYRDNVITIHYKSWNNCYEKDLVNIYNCDQIHLNEKGYQTLDSIIAGEVYKHYMHHTSKK